MHDFTAELLLKTVYIDRITNEQINIFTIWMDDTQKTELLELLDPKLILTTEFVSNLFIIKSEKIQKGIRDFFGFGNLILNKEDLIKKWIEHEPRILNYFTEDHLVGRVYSPKPETPFVFFHLLSKDISGIELLLNVTKKNPNVLKNLTFEHLTTTFLNSHSMFNRFSSSALGCALLERIILVLPNVFANIRTQHLMEKNSYVNSLLKNRSHLSTTLDNLILFDKGLTLLHHLMTDEFIKRFDPEPFFKHSLIIPLCLNQNGKIILLKLLTEYPKYRTYFSADVFFKCNSQMTENSSIFFNFFLGTRFSRHPEDKKLIEIIVRLNPSLIKCTISEIKKLDFETLIRWAVKMQLDFKNSGLNHEHRLAIVNWIAETDSEKEKTNSYSLS